MTLELGVCLGLMGLLFAGLCVAFVRHGLRQPIVPWPIGPLRRLRDRIRRANVIAAAQAATLAGEPKLATEMLGRYGIDLCPSCGQWKPLSSRMWARQVQDHLTYGQYIFVSVCHKCHASACPLGWVAMPQESGEVMRRANAAIRRIQQRVDVQMYQAYERAQIAMSHARIRVDQMRAQFAQRVANLRRRRR